jgi:transcriptional regulator with XRE-family HTH domain
MGYNDYLFVKLDGEVLEEVGKRLRELRKQKKMSQSDLADHIGVSRKHIGDIESGKGTTLLIFVKLLKLFNKSEKLLEILEGSAISPKDLFLKSQK